MRISIIYAIIFLSILQASGQEKVNILSDNITYLTGSKLKFEIENALDGNLYRIRLLDRNGTEIVSSQILGNNEILNCLELPKNLKSGTYVYLFTNETSRQKLYQNSIHVLNPETFEKNQISNSEANSYDVVSELFLENPMIIQGKVKNPTKNSFVILLGRGANDFFYYSKVNSDGSFSFSTPLHGKLELAFYHDNGFELNSDIEITGVPYQHQMDLINVEPFPLPSNLVSESIKKNLIDYFYSSEEEKKFESNFSSIEFDKTIYLADYFEQSSTTHIINEIVPLKRFREKNGIRELYLLNTSTNQYFKVKPLFLVDGFIVNSLEEVLQLDPSSIQEIRICYSNQSNRNYMGRYAGGGIISFHTKNLNYVPKGISTIKIIGLNKDNCD